jgi:hypothetical protein
MTYSGSFQSAKKMPLRVICFGSTWACGQRLSSFSQLIAPSLIRDGRAMTDNF